MNDKGSIAIIPIKGTITSEELYFGLISTSQDIIGAIENVEKKRKIKAVIFEINSPGGTPFASKEVATCIEGMKKPAIAWIREYATSGAYWIASACDEIVADELSTVGSIGVMSIRPDIGELLKKFGIDIETLKTGIYKGLGLPYEKPTEEERALLRKELDEIKDNFLNAIARYRKLGEETLKELAMGKVYLGREAQELGLVDHLGGKELAITRAKERSGIKREKIVLYGERKRRGFLRRVIEEILR
ncbi:MAG: signal peptide peptidase SppA [Methanophagales archaeon ANME-1-THS]|nr:MAG: signal peptide peptidase SppA [Methanophagales archaeon ANME-1-THS]